MTAPKDTLATRSAELLGDDVVFIHDACGLPIRGIIFGRWVTRIEWAVLKRAGLAVAPKMVPAPARRRSEATCPCPGCGYCTCKWVGDGNKRCSRSACICPRMRAPVRLVLHRLGRWRSVLELRRGRVLLAELGTWTQENGWDFSSAGDAKARSLPKVIASIVARGASARVIKTTPRAGYTDCNTAGLGAAMCGG